MTCPKLDPCTVTLAAPDVGWLPFDSTLSDGASNDKACVTVPARSPDVTTTRRVPLTPFVTLHTTVESDVQSVASHAL